MTLIEHMTAVVRSTRDIVLSHSQGTILKGYADFVTETDIEVQDHITQALKDIYPDIPVLSEENFYRDMSAKRFFILDPIDGTTNYIHGFPMFSVSLAYACDDVILCGIVYDASRDELFSSEIHQGSRMNGKRIMAGHKPHLQDALVGIGTSPYTRTRITERFNLFKTIFAHSLDIRRTGSAALDLCYVASGRLDLFYEQGLRIWDYAAGMLIARESGCIVTDESGQNIHLPLTSTIIAGHKPLVSELIVLIGEQK